MDAARYMDRCIKNVLVSWLVACLAVVAVDRYEMEISWLRGATPRVELSAAIAVSVCALFVFPFLIQRILQIAASRCYDTEFCKAVWRARLIGMGIGLAAGIFIEGL